MGPMPNPLSWLASAGYLCVHGEGASRRLMAILEPSIQHASADTKHPCYLLSPTGRVET